MKEIINGILARQQQPHFKKLALAEFLQHMILQSIYKNGFFNHLVFTGGTALRILYRISRFSEDLDFSLSKRKGFKFKSLLEKIKKDLELQRFPFDFYPKEEKTIAHADLRFSGLLQEFSLSPLKDQKLTVKLEIDTHPPAGGNQEIALVPEPISYTVSVYDLPSLFATKLHAIFFRGYTKGRDYYDLLWYLGKRVKPNFKLLNNAIRQTHGKKYEIHETEFKQKLLEHLKTVDFKKVRAEAERFIINPGELKHLDLALIENLIQRTY